jgi:two-component system cell cycle response regulator
LSRSVFSNKSSFTRAFVWAALAIIAVSVLHAITGLGGDALDDPLYFGAIAAAAAACLLALAANRRLAAASYSDSRTDPLTGLGNRRCLVEQLTQVLEKRRGPYVFALFDLDGFKAYNDSFGHAAGDSLLCKMAANLAATVEPEGDAYRLGGDEFCILVPAKTAGGEPIAAASAALSEQGTGFAVRTSWGAVFLPDEAHDAADALSLADRRMYVQKARRPRSPERQTRNVLLRALHERSPAIGDHLTGVAPLAVALGQAAGLGQDELDEVARAAELHDIGKIGVPDGILRKRGPLNQAEWTLMQNHTLIGERILSSAPAMAPVARLVRSTHERWDGSGYPDNLFEDEIPLGSRVIAVCDAFMAMTQPRPWRTTMSHDEALKELRACAGSQFDPKLVAVFCDRVYGELYETNRQALEPDRDVVGARDVTGDVA